MRDDRIDFIRCISNYLIVLLHSWAAFQYVKWSGVEFVAWTAICSHLCWMAIPTLFVISGYLLYTGYDVSKYTSKIARRVKRLAVPYIAWNTLFVVIYVSLAKFVPRLSARVDSFGLDSISGCLSKILSLTVGPIDGPLWYLRAIFILACVSPILWGIMKFWTGIPALVLCVGWCALESALGLKEILSLTAPAYAICCFVLGGVLSMHHKNLVDMFRGPSWIMIGVCACAISGGIQISNLLANSSVNTDESILISFLSVLEAPALLSLVSRFKVERITASPLYAVFNEMSFFVYAGHFLFCSIWLHTLAPLFEGYWHGKFTLLVLIFMTCGIGTMMFVYYVGKRVSPRLMKLLDGTL